MDRPNVLMIVVDTLRADYLGCYGSERGLTPRIDALASAGARFERAYSASNFTAPAFASIFTSRYPAQHGVYDFRIPQLPPHPALDGLRPLEYRRKAVVDFGFFKRYLRRSFDDIESLTDLAVDWSTEGPVVEMRRALAWMESAREVPFFFFLHVSPPHTPFRFPRQFLERVRGSDDFRRHVEVVRRNQTLSALVPESIEGRVSPVELERYHEQFSELPRLKLSTDEIAAVRYLYALEVMVVDEVVGELVDGLGRMGIRDRTIVSIASDHGEELWEHGGYGHGTSAMYDEVVRVPWIVAGPGVPPCVIAPSVSHVHMIPTLVDLAAGDAVEVAREASVRPLLEGAMEDRVVFAESWRFVAVVDGAKKLITRNRRRHFSSFKDRWKHHGARLKRLLTGRERPQLYDLVADPGERQNLAGRDHATVRRLERHLERYYASEAGLVGAAKLSKSEMESIKKELKGLGYY